VVILTEVPPPENTYWVFAVDELDRVAVIVQLGCAVKVTVTPLSEVGIEVGLTEQPERVIVSAG